MTDHQAKIFTLSRLNCAALLAGREGVDWRQSLRERALGIDILHSFYESREAIKLLAITPPAQETIAWLARLSEGHL